MARGLGLQLPFPAAVAAYYRSVFLNLTLPGGVVGDVHRGVSHGRHARDIGLALRAVAWERTAGQFVQAALTVTVLVALPSPARSSIPLVGVALVATVIAVALVGRARTGGGSRWARLRTAIAGDLRDALLARRAWPAIVLASALVVVGHAVSFVIAARTAGATAPLSLLVPLALLVMLAMVLPSVAGWGPREGAAAWAFAAAGLGAGQGVATPGGANLGTFSAAVAGLLGRSAPDSAAERTANATESMAETLDKIESLMGDMGVNWQ